jgi:hypothetical protein
MSARVESAGGIATLGRVEARDPDSLTLNVRLFAKLDSGLLAVDRSPQSCQAGIVRVDLEDLATLVVEALRSGELTAGHRAGYWGGVLDDLRETFGVRTDAETLMSLPFDLVPDAELAAEVEAA